VGAFTFFCFFELYRLEFTAHTTSFETPTPVTDSTAGSNTKGLGLQESDYNIFTNWVFLPKSEDERQHIVGVVA
jgi:hypothetical protein